MNTRDGLLEMKCTPGLLDGYVVRTMILRALQQHLAKFEGVLLDVGCGEMPYKPVLMAPPGRVSRYVGMDFPVDRAATFVNSGSVAGGQARPDLEWDGRTIPLADASVDCALATEVFEHCQTPESVMAEIFRVLKPGAFVFFTVPFVWPLHCMPYDEYRYTPFSLERHLRNAGFRDINIKGLSGWDGCLAQVIGLYVRRRPMPAYKRRLLSWLAHPLVYRLARRDRVPEGFTLNPLPSGLSGVAYK